MTTISVPVFAGPASGSIRPPGSKSETIRAMAAAALADGRSHLYMPLRAEDPAAMSGALTALGVNVAYDTEPVAVDGMGGWLSQPQGPLDVNESGLSARILLAMAASRDGVTTITGSGRLPERPMGGVLEVLRAQGVEVSGETLPIEVRGRGHLWGGNIAVDCSESSQFATAMMLVAPIMHEPCVLELRGVTGSAGYLEVTAAMMRKFGADVVRTVTGFEIPNSGYRPSDVVIEPDASAAVYPMAMAAVTGGELLIEGLTETTLQPDVEMASVLQSMGCRVTWEERGIRVDAREVELEGVDVDLSSMPDGALALAVVCMFASTPSRLRGLHSLRHKESDRLAAISSEMGKLGSDVRVEGDGLVVSPSRLHGAVVDPHGDHRIAMSMAVAGTVIPEVEISSPSVVNKTWPDFWRRLELLAEEVATRPL